MNKNLILYAFLLASCEPGVTFEVPQPEGRKNEQTIPSKFRGVYMSLEDSSIVAIDKHDIIRASDARGRAHTSELDSIDRITFNADTILRDLDSNDYVEIRVKGDSVFGLWHSEDTLFSLTKGNILRRFKGYCLLNRETYSNNWTVTKLGIAGSGIVLGTISTKTDLENLSELTNMPDTIRRFKPTKKQFRKFVKTSGFRNEEIFVKVSSR